MCAFHEQDLLGAIGSLKIGNNLPWHGQEEFNPAMPVMGDQKPLQTRPLIRQSDYRTA